MADRVKHIETVRQGPDPRFGDTVLLKGTGSGTAKRSGAAGTRRAEVARTSKRAPLSMKTVISMTIGGYASASAAVPISSGVVRPGIGGADLEQEAVEQAPRCERRADAQQRPDEDRPQCLADHQGHQLPGGGAQGQAHVQLVAPLRGDVGGDAVDADRRQQQGEGRERAGREGVPRQRKTLAIRSAVISRRSSQTW